MKFDEIQASIFGLHGSGKTELAKYIARHNDALVYDIIGDYSKDDDYDVYYAKKKQYPDTAKELGKLVKYMQKKKKWNMLIIDEASRIVPNRKPIPEPIRLLLDNYRQIGINPVWISRRPADINTYAVETSKYIFCFKLLGKNDKLFLDNISIGLGARVRQLKKYEFCIIDGERNHQISEPIPFKKQK